MRSILNKKIIALSCAGLFLLLAAPACYAYKIEVSLPGMTSDSVSDPGAYIRYLFIFGVSLAGFLAVGMIIYGGVKYMLAASVGNTQDAKDKILGALGGVALIMCSYLLLYTIDPSLTNLSPSIKPLGNISAPPPSPSNIIGSKASQYQWTKIPVNQYCAKVLGSGWETVDASHCSGASPGLSYDCCGKF